MVGGPGVSAPRIVKISKYNKSVSGYAYKQLAHMIMEFDHLCLSVYTYTTAL